MVKKIILTGTLIAWLLTQQNACSPVLVENTPKTSFLENSVQKNLSEYKREWIRKKRILAEEKELLEKDEIYNLLNLIYKELNPKNYLTKKFVRSLIKVESGDYPGAVSNIGARGLGQLTQKAWYEVEKENYWKNVFIPEKNIRTTIKYLVWIDQACEKLNPNWVKLSHKERVDLIAAAYNGGIGTLKEKGWNIAKMGKETREYIPKINKTSEEFIPSVKIYESVF